MTLSCFKPTETENEFIVRVYDIEGKNEASRLSFNKSIQSAKLIDLCENEICDLSFDDKTVIIPIEANSILTLKIRLNE